MMTSTDDASTGTDQTGANAMDKHQVDEEVATNISIVDATNHDGDGEGKATTDFKDTDDDQQTASIASDSHSKSYSNSDDVMIAVDEFASSRTKRTQAVKDVDLHHDEESAAIGTASVVDNPLKLSERRWWIGRTAGCCFLLVPVLLFVLTITGTIGNQDDGHKCYQSGDNFREFNVPPCTFEECFESRCDPVMTPFVCQENNGSPHGGCAATPWNLTTGVCSNQCDRSCCHALPIPDYIETCDVQCPKEWCDNSTWCAMELAFQCMEGGAKNGCSWDKIQWTFKSTDEECTKCCNTNTCWAHYMPEDVPEN